MSTETTREIVDGCYAARARRLARQVTRVYDDHLRPLGLRAAQQTVLTAIADGTTRPVDLGIRLDMDKSTVSRTLRTMESNGWITLRSKGGVHSIALTPAGRRLLERSLEPWRSATSEVEHRLRDGLLPYLTDDESANA